LKEETILKLSVQFNNKESTIGEFISDIIKGDTEKMVIVARRAGIYIGQELPKKERLYPYQIRRILGSIRKLQIETFDYKKIQLLKPQLVFTAAKSDANLGIEHLKDLLIFAIDKIGDNEKYFRNFCDFFESIMAYYQAAENE